MTLPSLFLLYPISLLLSKNLLHTPRTVMFKNVFDPKEIDISYQI